MFMKCNLICEDHVNFLFPKDYRFYKLIILMVCMHMNSFTGNIANITSYV